MRKDIYLTCEANGRAGAERAANRHRPAATSIAPATAFASNMAPFPSGVPPFLAALPTVNPNLAIASSSKTTDNHSLRPARAACGAFSIAIIYPALVY